MTLGEKIKELNCFLFGHTWFYCSPYDFVSYKRECAICKKAEFRENGTYGDFNLNGD